MKKTLKKELEEVVKEFDGVLADNISYTLYDRQLNNWLHDYLYKKFYPDEVGKTLRKMYEAGEIRNENEFEEALKNVLSNCQK